ncbi:MAG TPA: hypothetical protein VGS58_15255 [Candidatus Sulfopaludibacter sp.]|nr:hypothetical protein [Candidatus Sulfopaludibacter sp.]
MNRFHCVALVLAATACSAPAADPIRLHPGNPHYFEFRGKAVALVTSGEHYGSVINEAFDYRRYLAALAADGLNYTRLFGGSYIEIPGRSFGIRRNNLAPEPGRFVAPWEKSGDKFDLQHWNPKFFERYHDFLAEASKLGIVVEVTLFSSYYQEAHWTIGPFNPANNVNATDAIDWRKLHTLENGNILAWQERYARKLVGEAREFDNVIFEIQNEPWSDRGRLASVVNPYLQPPARDRYPNSIDLADALSAAWQARVAQWIDSEESRLPRKHLVAQNYANFGFPAAGLAPGVSIVNFHYAYPTAVEANYGLGKVIGYDETGFLGRDDATYLRQAWNFLLSGGGLFNHLDYSFTVGHEDGTDAEPNGPGGGSPALRHSLGVLASLLNSMPLAGVRPDTRVVRHAAGVSAKALSTAGGAYVMYFDGNGPTTVTLDLPAGDYAGAWIDIQTGKTAPLPRLHSGSEQVHATPAFTHGIALRIERSVR